MKKEILEVVESVESQVNDWTADDGLMYASDILSQCNTVRKKLDALDQNDFHFWFKKWVGGWDGALSAKTSAEAELTQGIWWVLDDYSDDDRLIRCDDCGTLYSFTHYDGVCPDCGKTVK